VLTHRNGKNKATRLTLSCAASARDSARAYKPVRPPVCALAQAPNRKAANTSQGSSLNGPADLFPEANVRRLFHHLDGWIERRLWSRSFSS